jgi:hypothetical protein
MASRLEYDDLDYIKSALEHIQSTPGGISSFLIKLGYSLIPERERKLDTDILLQKKDLREHVINVRKLFSEKAKRVLPSGAVLDREAVILLVELKDENELRSRFPFEITRYLVKFSFPAAQVIFFFISPSLRTFVTTAYTIQIDNLDRVIIRRLVAELDNITRTDLESFSALRYTSLKSARLIIGFEEALPPT